MLVFLISLRQQFFLNPVLIWYLKHFFKSINNKIKCIYLQTSNSCIFSLSSLIKSLMKYHFVCLSFIRWYFLRKTHNRKKYKLLDKQDLILSPCHTTHCKIGTFHLFVTLHIYIATAHVMIKVMLLSVIFRRLYKCSKVLANKICTVIAKSLEFKIYIYIYDPT